MGAGAAGLILRSNVLSRVLRALEDSFACERKLCTRKRGGGRGQCGRWYNTGKVHKKAYSAEL